MLIRYSDAQRDETLSSTLLKARLHMRNRPVDATVMCSVRDALSATGGSHVVGDEPGSTAYFAGATTAFIRTSELSGSRLGVFDSRSCDEHVADYAAVNQDIQNLDVLVAKDGPVGSASLLLWEDAGHSAMISSGIVRFRFPGKEWFYYGVLKFGNFTRDIDLVTPTGSTYRHAGQDVLLSAQVPRPVVGDSVQDRIALLAEVAVRSELWIRRRYVDVIAALEAYTNTSVAPLSARKPSSYGAFLAEDRLDATAHAALNGSFWEQVKATGYASLADLVASGDIERGRGQNLQFTAIGFSEKVDDYRPGLYRLVEPGFVDTDLFIPKWRYLWCPRPLKTVADGSVLFSAEGSIGNVGVVYALADLPTITNIHGLVLNSTDDDREARNAWIVANVAFFRDKGWLDAIAVGGQGGSLAMKYHHLVPILNWDDEVGTAVATSIVREGKCPSADELAAMPGPQLSALLDTAKAWSIGDLSELRANAASAGRDVLLSSYPALA